VLGVLSLICASPQESGLWHSYGRGKAGSERLRGRSVAPQLVEVCILGFASGQAPAEVLILGKTIL